MPTPSILTFADSCEHVRDFLKSDASELTQRIGRRATLAALRDLAQRRDWSYLRRRHILELNASYSTGTITYTASSRVLTLATGTWPTWAASGTVRIANASYEVYSRTSGSAIVLEANNCPVDDIAAGTSYVIYQNQYALPNDFRRLCRPDAESNWAGMQYKDPAEWSSLDRNSSASGDPQIFTIVGDPNTIGGFALCVYPYPSSNKTLQFIYSKQPADPVYTGYETATSVGTIASTADGTTITGTSTTFADAHIGHFIRFSADSTAPEGEAGLNPFLEQKVITARASATSLTVDSAMVNTLSGVGYKITSPIDIAPYMLNAFLRGLERQAAIFMQMAGLNNIDALYNSALISAMENDSNVSILRSPLTEGGYYPQSYTVS